MLQRCRSLVDHWAAVLALAAGVATMAWSQGSAGVGNTRDGLLLSVAADKQAYKVDEPVMVTASFTNISDVPVDFERERPAFFFFYRFLVVRTVGVDSVLVPLTDYGKRQADVHNLWAVGGFKLKPGERNESLFKLNEFYEMRLPGVYKILVVAHMRTRTSGKSKVEFRSDLLTVAVE